MLHQRIRTPYNIIVRTDVHKARKLKSGPLHTRRNLRTGAPTVRENKDGRYVEFMGVKTSVLGGYCRWGQAVQSQVTLGCTRHSAGSNLFLRNRVVGPRERILMKNDNRKKYRKNIELFNGETCGGSWGGSASLQAYEVWEYASFL